MGKKGWIVHIWTINRVIRPNLTVSINDVLIAAVALGHPP